MPPLNNMQDQHHHHQQQQRLNVRRRSSHYKEVVDPTKDAFRKTLTSLDLPPGLLSSVLQSHKSNDSRLWVIDNSSSMKVRDSHVGRAKPCSNGNVMIEKVDNVTRWEELQETVAFHSRMASKCWIPTKYWLLNPNNKSAVGEHHRHKFTLCWGAPEDVPSEMAHVRNVMSRMPLDQAKCPLAACIRSLAKGLAKEAPSLKARGHHLTLVICTQGLVTDSKGHTSSTVVKDFVKDLSSLGKLPVKIIVRLTTDEEKVVDLFNTMDSQCESIDVLDDFWGEAMEVYLHNPWLTYSMGLHRLREAGFAPDIMNDLDERPLTLDEIHQLCKILFLGGSEDNNGCVVVDLPHPKLNWFKFMRALAMLIGKEKFQWNPVRKGMTPWINLKKLDAMHGPKKERGGLSRQSSAYLNRSARLGDQNNDHGPRRRRHTVHDHNNTSAQHSRELPKQRSQNWTQEQHTRSDSRGRQHQQQRRRTVTEHRTQQPASRPTTATALPSTLPGVLKQWSHEAPRYKSMHPLQDLLVTVPQTFPPTNTKVEEHEYFAKWKTFDKEAFADESVDELKELLKRAVRKAKFFLHPDKLPKDLTDNQTLLFKTMWEVLTEREAATLG